MRESVVTDNHSITFLPLNREAEIVSKLSPEFPVIPRDVAIVSEGHLDGSVLRLKLHDTRPRIEPSEMVSDVGIRYVLVPSREVFEC